MLGFLHMYKAKLKKSYRNHTWMLLVGCESQIEPPEFELHAIRPASGLLADPSISPVYPPDTMIPPTCESVMSKNAPPLMFGEETSSTPPSQNTPPLNSVLKLFRKVNIAEADVMLMFGVSSTLSLIMS